MSRIAYVNGQYVRRSDAGVSIEDRGYQFADAVYEACQIRDRAIIDLPRHLDRLARSLAALEIAPPMSRIAMTVVLKEVARRNRVSNGLIYWQISRGVAHRNHAFPAGVEPSFVITAETLDQEAQAARIDSGIAVLTVPDNRWDRVDIKTVGLLPNVLAKQQARVNGAYEAVFVDRDGFVTEGSSTNVWIVTADGTLVTRPADHGILRGITRSVVFDVAAAEGVAIEERPFTIDEAKSAREMFITAASTILLPVVKVDETVIANGAPGLTTGRLRSRFYEFAERTPF